jgi:hypothetical protein
MKKAQPIRPLSTYRRYVPEPWEVRIASFDRGVRRSNFNWKLHTFRLDPRFLGLVSNERKFPRDIFTRLTYLSEYLD